MSPAEQGKQARFADQDVSANPYIIGYTKLGAPKLSEDGIEWERGFYSVQRFASKKELNDAEAMDISKFRKKI